MSSNTKPNQRIYNEGASSFLFDFSLKKSKTKPPKTKPKAETRR